MEFTITPVAEKHFQQLLSAQEEGTGIRVFVINPGSVNAECGVAYCPPKSIEETDYIEEFEHFNVYIDNISYSFLNEAVIDIQEDEMKNSSLTIKAPNAKMKKVGDDAPLIERVDYYINTVVNPQLKSHGGMITLVSIENNTAVIQFGGGCNGCTMADVTLKEGVEKQLIENFAGEILKVIDVTDHITGEHSFYQ